jgi:hypothetical protein
MNIGFSSIYLIPDFVREYSINLKKENTPKRSPPIKGLDFIRETLLLVLQEVEALGFVETHRCDECEYCVKENE